MARKARPREELRERIEADPKKQAAYGAAWDKIADVAEGRGARSPGRTASSSAASPSTRSSSRSPGPSSGWPRRRRKPNADRLREYRDSALESLKLDLFSDAPIYPEFEKAKLAHSLAFWKKSMAATTRWSSASSAAGPPSRRPRSWSRAPSSPTSRSARRSPRGAWRPSRRPTTR